MKFVLNLYLGQGYIKFWGCDSNRSQNKCLEECTNMAKGRQQKDKPESTSGAGGAKGSSKGAKKASN